jgi:hypothetical protein
MSSSRFNLLAVAAGFSMLAASVGHAGVSVQGTPDAVRIEVEKASIEEVLQALHETYGLTYTSKIRLGKEISGTYDGPLSRVVALLLRGTNFVLTHSGETLQVVIISAQGKGDTVGTPPAVQLPATVIKPSPTPQWQAELFKLVPPPPPAPTPSARDTRDK